MRYRPLEQQVVERHAEAQAGARLDTELRLETGLWLPITSRPRFVLNEDQTVVSTSSTLGVFSSLGIGVRL